MPESLRVLIVEDSEDDAELLLLELRRGGYDPAFVRVDTAEGMRNALEKYSWDVIVSDYSMPRFDTIAALELVKERELDLPFIIVSGRIGEDVAVQSMKAGAHDYIMKDNLVRLVPAIQRELREAEQRRERRRAEKALERYHKRLEILREIDKAILAIKSPREIAEATLGRLCELLPCERGCVVMIDTRTEEATVLAVFSCDESRIHQGMRLPVQSWASIDMLSRGDVHIIEDLRESPQAASVIQVLRAEGYRSYLSAPLVSHGHLIGSLNLWATREHAFGDEQLEVAREVATLLAIAIQQARMYEQIQEHTHQLEQNVAERTIELQQMNADLESFSASISHDLRAPLRAVQGFAEVLGEEYADALDENGKEYIERIVASTSYMDTLIQDLLEYSRLNSPDIECRSLNLSSAVTEALTRLDSEIRKRDARVEVCEPFPHVVGHRAVTVKIISNLVTNALKFVPDGTRPQITIQCEDNDTTVRLSVQDNGIGIEPEYHDRIFRIFERLHGADRYSGTGIGLAIVRKGMERMEGRVGVESKVGSGSRFWIEWPKS